MKITKKQLAQIIREEMQKEGFFRRLKHKVMGATHPFGKVPLERGYSREEAEEWKKTPEAQEMLDDWNMVTGRGDDERESEPETPDEEGPMGPEKAAKYKPVSPGPHGRLDPMPDWVKDLEKEKDLEALAMFQNEFPGRYPESLGNFEHWKKENLYKTDPHVWNVKNRLRQRHIPGERTVYEKKRKTK